ncbi:MAG: type transport system permease protein [Thermoanaerobacter sp.]|nr:type transport system permease protein [Thermoanaerobacter sp.]
MTVSRFKKIFLTEFKQIFRVPDIYVIAFFLPVFVTLILRGIFSMNALPGSEYSVLEYSFGGIVSIGICGTGIMGLSSILSEYRHNGILKRFMVSPVSPLALMMSIYLSLMILSIFSSIAVMIEFYIMFSFTIQSSIFILIYLFAMIAIFSNGMLVASLVPNQRIGNVITMLIYFPTLFISGTTIPYEVLPDIVQKVSMILPMTHAIKLMKETALGIPVTDNILSILYLTITFIIFTLLSIKYFKWS